MQKKAIDRHQEVLDLIASDSETTSSVSGAFNCVACCILITLSVEWSAFKLLQQVRGTFDIAT